MRVLLAEDQELIRDGLAMMLRQIPQVSDLHVASDGDSALALALELKPDVLLTDVDMPGINGITVTERLLRAEPASRVLILSASEDEQTILHAIKAGACGYVLKSSASIAEIGRALDSLNRGDAHFSPRVAALMARWLREGSTSHDPLAELSPRQREIIELLARGQSIKEVAFSLGLSRSTVETHRALVLKKLGLKDNGDLMRFAFEYGLAKRT